jgi:hypothetical protein
MTRSVNYALVTGIGLIAAIATAVLWAVVTTTTGYRIGWMAIGVGFAVAFAVRLSAESQDEALSYIAAGCALIGCVLGNYLSWCTLFAVHEGAPLTHTVFALLPKFPRVLAITFRPMDLLYYGIAVYSGFKYSRAALRRRAAQRN